MDNNNNQTNDPSIDPSLLAPQGMSPVTPAANPTTAPQTPPDSMTSTSSAPIANHLIDITPGAAETSPVPEAKVIDITPSEATPNIPVTPVVEASPLTPMPSMDTTASPLSAPMSQTVETPVATPAAPVSSTPAQSSPAPVSPLQEDPNSVQTIG